MTASSPSGRTPGPLAGRTVLVVEDSRVQRDHAADLVRGLGALQVEEAANGLEGLARLAKVPAIELVLTDLDMPHMDGIAFIGEAAARGFRPEVIVTSGQEPGVLHAVQLMAEAWGLKVPGVLAKPLKPEAVARLLALGAAAPAPAVPSEGPAFTLADLAEGLKAGAFLCHFQPQVTFRGALLKGVEALVRWARPGFGLIGPAAFLPLMETDAELMRDLTFAVLAHAAEHWHGWRRRGLNLEVAVNLSAFSMSEQGFADELMAAAARLDLPPQALILELTESASVSNLGHTLANLARLRMRGFKLSIDDFGTGFATFEQLERIPFSELKLDRSIVRNLPHSARHRVMAESLLHLTRGLRLGTVAEGIETLETWRTLRAMGCERGQGFLIARPMPGHDLMAWSQLDRAHLRV